MARLRDDVSAAMTRASLKAGQIKTLNKSQETLRLAVEAHANQIKFNEGEISNALKRIAKETNDGWFAPQDRTIIAEDLKHIPIREPRPRPVRPPRPVIIRRFP